MVHYNLDVDKTKHGINHVKSIIYNKECNIIPYEIYVSNEK